MIPDSDGEPKSRENDAEQLSRLIELEMEQKRVAWKQASARHQKVRVASFLFLFLLVIGSLFAFFLLFSHANEQRANRPTNSTPAASDR